MKTKNVLIVDDEPDIRELLEITLGRMGLNTRSAADLESAHTLLAREEFDLCLTDMNLPDGNGLLLINTIQEKYSHIPVAMITAYGSVEIAINALKAGAFDFVSKPIDLDGLRKLVSSALKLNETGDAVGYSGKTQLLGETTAIKTLRQQIQKLARSQAPIYISGESGSGKELVARLIHAGGPRANGPFIAINCGAIPSELMESELFGHKKGSFTGAIEDKIGLFQAASNGTLFLDEVADLPLAMQVKLLRAIQEKSVRPIGSQEEVPVDVRLLSATHKKLADEVEQERFRSDLFYRINVIELKVPSLRERREDIPLLAEFILAQLAEQASLPAPKLDDGAKSLLMDYRFPGNVRELENLLERAYTLCEGDTLTAADLSFPEAGATQGADSLYPEVSDEVRESVDSLESFLENIERDIITRALESTRWNKTNAAKKLGISFRAMRYKLQKLGIE
jgi:two-component system response regulator PilR (NtrC family)